MRTPPGPSFALPVSCALALVGSAAGSAGCGGRSTLSDYGFERADAVASDATADQANTPDVVAESRGDVDIDSDANLPASSSGSSSSGDASSTSSSSGSAGSSGSGGSSSSASSGSGSSSGGSGSSGSSASSGGGTCVPSPSACSRCLIGQFSCSSAGSCQCCLGTICLPGGGTCGCVNDAGSDARDDSGSDSGSGGEAGPDAESSVDGSGDDGSGPESGGADAAAEGDTSDGSSSEAGDDSPTSACSTLPACPIYIGCPSMSTCVYPLCYCTSDSACASGHCIPSSTNGNCSACTGTGSDDGHGCMPCP